MPSKTSSSKGLFNAALCRNDLMRFWPLWAGYLAIWLLAMPVMQLLALFGRNGGRYVTEAELQRSAMRSVTSVTEEFTLVLVLIFGCLFAMALFSYITAARSTGFAHALPVKREGLYLTHYLTGAGVFLAIHGVVALLTLAAWAAAGVGHWELVGIWFLVASGTMLFFYSLAALCAMFAGQILAVPVFYGILNGLVAALYFLLNMLGEIGFYGWSSSGFPTPVRWLTPIWMLEEEVGGIWKYNEALDRMVYEGFEGLGVVGGYAAAGLVLAALALLVYRRRKSESAGDTVAIGWARPVFRYGVGVCSALSLGLGLYALLWSAFYGGDEALSPLMLAVCMALLGLVGYFAAEMLLRKSFRVLKGGWKGAAVLSACLVALCAAVALDLPGIEHRVPAADQVESLSYHIRGYSSLSGVTGDAGQIARFADFHRQIAQLQPDNDDRHSFYAGQETGMGEEERDRGYSVNCELIYFLKNGRQLSRDYYFWYDVPEEDPLVAQLAALCGDTAIQRQGMADLEAVMKDPQRLRGADIELFDRTDESWPTKGIDREEALTLAAALFRDVDAGHAGQSSFPLPGEDRSQVYLNTLSFLCREAPNENGDYRYRGDSWHRIEFSTEYTYLLAELERLGLTDDLITDAEMAAREEASSSKDDISVSVAAETAAYDISVY